VFKKARAAPAVDDAEVAIVDEFTCVYRTENDMIVAIVGEASENELLLEAALSAVLDSLRMLLKRGVTKSQVSCARTHPPRCSRAPRHVVRRADTTAPSLRPAPLRSSTHTCPASCSPSTRCWTPA